MSTTTPAEHERRGRKGKRAPQRYVPQLAPVDDAAEFLDCHRRTVLRMIHDGKLNAYRVGRHLKVDMNQVHDLAKPVPPESVAC